MRARILGGLGRTQEAIDVAEEGLALELRDGTGPGATLGAHRWFLGELLREVGRHDEATAHYQAVLDDLQSEPGNRQVALSGLASCALAANDASTATRYAEESVQLAEGMGEDVLCAALGVLVQARKAAGDLPAARATAERALEAARRLGSAVRLYFALRNAAVVALDEGDAARARPLLDEAEPLAKALDVQRGLTELRDQLADLRGRIDALFGGDVP